MRKQVNIHVLFVILLVSVWGCSIKWTDAIRYGRVSNNAFKETIKGEIQKGLIFVPITIKGKNYRFLFDSGAPFSISDKLQSEYAYKVVSKGNIVDSDQNKKKVSWVQVDSIHIGDISFVNKTAFIGDFDANPILSCLGIDGIIGSNLIRHCAWTIDQQSATVTLSSRIDKLNLKGFVSIPFKTDYQYNIFINVNIGKATVKNVLVDYGSNGSISLDEKIFAALKERNSIGLTLLEKGVQQSGLIGGPVAFNREITYLDSLYLDTLQLSRVMLSTGKTTSVGNGILSGFRISIDWDNKNLYLKPTGEVTTSQSSFGFKIGRTGENDIYIQSVIENSAADEEGIRPDMRVAKIDTLDFENGDDFCDYVRYEPKENIILQLLDFEGRKRDYHIKKQPLIYN